MANGWIVLAGVWVGLGGLAMGVAAQRQAAAAAVPAKKTCTVNTMTPNPAETALNRGDANGAEPLFRELLAKNQADERAREGLVRALIAQDKVDIGAKEAETWVAASPASSMAMVALGEARLRQGDPREAALEFQDAGRADLCNERAYMGLSRVDELAGMHASSKKLIEHAYLLHPTDDEINSAWIETRPRQERLERLADYAERSDQITDENRAKLRSNLKEASLYRESDCQVSPSSPAKAAVPMVALMDGPYRFAGWALEVRFNGKGRQLKIDSEYSGIMISRAAALFLGIKPEDETLTWGVKTKVTHIASIKIGGLEFTNCAVEILDKWGEFDSDGLIGGDVFAHSLLTLDFPKHELRIAPLPQRPKRANVQSTPGREDGDDDEVWHDPYVAPEMADWQRFYSIGSFLLVPAGFVDTQRLNDEGAWKEGLFDLDTTSDLDLISSAAAREVTTVSRNQVRDIYGQVDKVNEAGKFTLAFAGLRLDTPSMRAVDMTESSHDTGVEVSGTIGTPTLFQLVMHIDYRDNLILFEHASK